MTRRRFGKPLATAIAGSIFLLPALPAAEISEACETLHIKCIEAWLEVAQPVEKPQAACEKKLKELEAGAGMSGDIGCVSIIRSELANYKANPKRAADQRLHAEQRKYELSLRELEKNRRIQEDEPGQIHVVALDSLTVAESKAGKIESAKRVRREIDKRKQFLVRARKTPLDVPGNLPHSIPFTRFKADDTCVVKKLVHGVELTGKKNHQTWFQTRDKFSPPFKATFVAMTNSTNLRLKYGKGQIIFNWEVRPKELRIHDPVNGKPGGVKDQGKIPTDQWVTVELTYKPNSMSIAVDGKERFQGAGDFKDIDAQLGIGPAFGSVVSLKGLRVDKL